MSDWIDLIEAIGKLDGEISDKAFLLFFGILILLGYIVNRMTQKPSPEDKALLETDPPKEGNDG